MERVIEEFGWDLNASLLLQAYDAQIESALQSGREKGIDFPEVEIREIWRDIFSNTLPTQFLMKGLKKSQLATNALRTLSGPCRGGNVYWSNCIRLD